MTILSKADLDRTEAVSTAGNWLCLFSRHTWLLVDLPRESTIVQQCELVLARHGTADELLQALVSDGIPVAPEFALIRLSQSERRAIVRGGAVVHLGGATPITVWARPDMIWADSSVGDGVSEVYLTCGVMQSLPDWRPLSESGLASSAVRLSFVLPSESPIPPAAPALLGVIEPEPQSDPDPEPVASEGSYDYLWGMTQRGLPLGPLAPAAAVENGLLDTGSAPPPAMPASEPASMPVAALPRSASIDETIAPSAWNTMAQTADEGLIDAVPWQSGGIPAAPVAAPPPMPIPVTPRVPSFVREAASAPTLGPPAPPSSPPPVVASPTTEAPHFQANTGGTTSASTPDRSESDTDHTINRATLAAEAARAAAAAAAGDVPLGPSVRAVRCPVGHLTPPYAPLCRVCRQPIAQQESFEIARPSLGVLRLSTGDVVTLDRGVVIGRSPETAQLASADRPNLLRLQSPHNDLSRNHAEVVIDGWNVYIRDLGSTNGTTVSLPGQLPTRLRVHDLFLLEPGAMLNLADEVNIQFEVTA